MRSVLLSLVFLIFLAGTLFAQQPQPPQQNAALKYWQAYASMSRALNEKTKEKVNSYFETPIDEVTMKAVRDCTHAMVLLHKGAVMNHCAWEINIDDGPGSTIEHYEPVRALARLACLSARTHFEKGLPSAGVNDIFAMVALGRHVGTDDLVVCRLTQCSIENLGIITLARYLPMLDEEELKELQQRLDALPPVKEPKDSQMADKDLKNGLAALKVRHQLLLAAVSFVSKGPEALRNFKDPYGEGPFLYRKLKKGFELRSGLHKHVRVTVGQEPEDS